MTTQTPAHVIVEQLGGSRFAAATGSIMVTNGDMLLVKFNKAGGLNYMTVTYNKRYDLYDVEFGMHRNNIDKPVLSYNHISSNDLVDLFENVTGYRTSF